MQLRQGGSFNTVQTVSPTLLGRHCSLSSDGPATLHVTLALPSASASEFEDSSGSSKIKLKYKSWTAGFWSHLD